MLTLLLLIIYMSFISLGLPDSLLGSAWPVMRIDLGADVSYAGIISMIISCGTVVSSLMSTRLIKKFGTGVVTLVSVGMTAAALIGFSLSGSFIYLCFLAIPLGLGAGSVDAALNNFVALHYKARHMNWLHCFWGIGATAGPFIMAVWLNKNNSWPMGYRTIGLIQAVLTAILFLSLPLWKRFSKSVDAKKEDNAITALPLKEIIKIKNAKPVLLSLFCYCSLELTAGLWSGSFATIRYGVSAETAAKWTSIFYLGITLGRLVSGFISIKLKNHQLVRIGQLLIVAGILLLLLPLPVWKVPIGIIMIGTGCAPIYPAMLHNTPETFGKSISQAMMGVQMACAYIGSTFMPSLFGLIAGKISISLFPFYLLLIILVMITCTEFVNRRKQPQYASIS